MYWLRIQYHYPYSSYPGMCLSRKVRQGDSRSRRCIPGAPSDCKTRPPQGLVGRPIRQESHIRPSCVSPMEGMMYAPFPPVKKWRKSRLKEKILQDYITTNSSNIWNKLYTNLSGQYRTPKLPLYTTVDCHRLLMMMTYILNLKIHLLTIRARVTLRHE